MFRQMRPGRLGSELVAPPVNDLVCAVGTVLSFSSAAFTFRVRADTVLHGVSTGFVGAMGRMPVISAGDECRVVPNPLVLGL
jgi:hypothetical protein